MAKYRVHLKTYASTSVTVEADDESDAIDKAYDESLPTICAHCAGWGKEYSLELGDEWEPSVGPNESELLAVEEVTE